MTQTYRAYDLADASLVPNLPTNGDFYLGYTDGNYLSYPAMVARFGSKAIGISAIGHTDPLILDVETSDITPTQAIAIASFRKLHLKLPTVIYTNLSTKAQFPADYFASETEWPKPASYWWAADPTGVPHIVPGSIGTQYLWDGNNYDESIFSVDLSLGLVPATTPKPVPTPPIVPPTVTPSTTTEEDDDMIILRNATTGACCWFNGTSALHINAIETVLAAEKAGIKLVTVPSKDYPPNVEQNPPTPAG